MNRNRQKYIKRIHVLCTVSLIVSILFLIGFLHGRDPGHWSGYILNTEAVGQFGDFVGGLIGTFVSAVLLYYTFKLQREDSEEHTLVYKTEQLYSLFFRLVDQYHKILDNLFYEIEDEEKLRGKEALHYKYEVMRDEFIPSKSNTRNRKMAVSAYMDFYSLNRDFSPIFFRTLYRAYQTVAKADKEIEEKAIELMKVLRAQMTDTELVLLRYNAMTKQSNDFCNLINRFNILKHMPPLELMEYTYWRKQMTLDEQGCTNVLLLQTKENMFDVLESGSKTNAASYSSSPKTYNINVSTNDNKSELQLCLYINPAAQSHDNDLIRGIRKLSPSDRLSLLRWFMEDCVVYSTFNRLNDYRQLVFSSTDDSSNGKWYAKVIRKDGKPLRLRSVVQ